MNKRGVSSVIATVLLIALVVVLSAIVFLWARGFIKEQIEKFGTPIENQCDNVNWEVHLITSDGKKYYLTLSNKGNIPIYDISIGLKDGGRTEMKTMEPNIKLNPGTSLKREFDLVMDKGDIQELIFYPILLGKVVGKEENKMKTCLDQGITIKV